MIIPLGAALSVKVQYCYPRGDSYQFRIRIPQHLVSHYGKEDIRKSLGKDAKEATKKAEEYARRYQAEFKVLTEGKPITPQDVATDGRMLAEQYDSDFEHFLDHVIRTGKREVCSVSG